MVLLTTLLNFGAVAGGAPNSPPPSNGSSDRGGTTYYPAYNTNSGTSVGVTVTPNPGTPQSAPSSKSGCRFHCPATDTKVDLTDARPVAYAD
jgi:hypothetical protein